MSEQQSNHYGQATMALVNETFSQGVERGVLLMRHSARTFDRDIHDLENRLTDHGRDLCRALGAGVDKSIHLRGYASPAHRCMETSQIVITQHQEDGGSGGRTRALEALGPFYALDQQKMWKGLTSADGLADYIARWYAGDVPEDAMMPPAVAVQMILRVLKSKIAAAGEARQLDLCVSHDMTLFTVRHGVGLEPVDGPPVEFLDGLLVFMRDGEHFMRSQHGGETQLSLGC